jgi:hypothetical protein
MGVSDIIVIRCWLSHGIQAESLWSKIDLFLKRFILIFLIFFKLNNLV